MSLDPRPKTGQVMASNGLVFYRSVSSGDWDFNQIANAVVDQQASGVPLLLRRQQKKINILASDLIIDKVLINSASPAQPVIPYQYQASLCNPSLVRVCDRKQGANSVLAPR